MREYFSGLYGNSATKARLGAAIDSDTLPHAFLILGADGSGKKTLALELAAALNCEKKSDEGSPLPCRRCNTCRRIFDGNFTDISRIRPSDGKATIGVEEVRIFREDMHLSPTESRYKIYVIDEAEKLTANAQNALLTVLEEPPRNVVIMLLADSGDKILTTIKSRTQSIAMQRFYSQEIKNYLKSTKGKSNLLKDDASINGILMSADGRIGKAIELLSEKESRGNADDRSLTERIVAALHTSVPYSELYTAISELPSSRREFIYALESLICAIRDITLIKFGDDIQLLFYTYSEDAKAAAKDMNTKRLIKIYEILKDALEDSSRNVSTSAIMADLGAKIRLI